MGLNAEYIARIKALVARSEDMPESDFLARVLLAASLWRSKIWANTIGSESTHVRSGPFKGMDYVVQSAEGAILPRLLGIYERELHPALYQLASERIDHVIDVGCAEGYYAVGLARLLPGARVHAYDIDETARRRCGILARANGVADRVQVSGEFKGDRFDEFKGSRVLVFVDAEGFEDELLQPDLYPALADFDIIVETHPMNRPGITNRLIERFASTHTIVRHDPQITDAELPPALANAAHLDMMIAGWEWRAGPTPWLVMRPRSQPSIA